MLTDINSQMWLRTAVMASMPIYLVMQIWLAVAWRGGWWLTASVPLIVIMPALAFTAYATMAGPNIGPLPFVLASPLALLYLIIALIVRAARKTSAA